MTDSVSFEPGNIAMAYFDASQSKKPVLLLEKNHQYWLVQTKDNWFFWIWEKKLSTLG